MAQVTLQVVVNFDQVNKLQETINKLNGTKINLSTTSFTKSVKESEKISRELLKTEKERQRVIVEETKARKEAVRVETEQQKKRTAEAQTERETIKNQREIVKLQREKAKAQREEENATKNANKEVKKQGLLYDILGRSVSSFLARMVAYRAVYAGIRAITNGFREALETLKAVDDELVTVRKVTGFDEYQMARVEEQAYAVASKYGTSASDYTSSVAAFARAGYKDLSGDLAELAEKTKIVGDTTADVAQQTLLSVDAAYKYRGDVEKLSAVLDGMNEIDNKFATSIERIAEGMGIVAPVAAQMNVSVDELAAGIGTITAVTQRSGTEAARALRAIFLNIVGDTKTEIEEGVTWTTGEIAGLRDVIKLYAKDAYDAAQASGEVIDPMRAIAGLAQSVKDGILSEAKLTEMVSDIGGKLRTSQLLAIVKNWDMYENMLQTYRTAYGSAEKEIDNAMDSWTRKTNVLKNTWTQFVKTGLNSEAVKGFLDILTSIVQRLGTLPGVLTRIAVIVVGMKLPQITKSVTAFFADIKKNGIGSINGLSAAIAGLGVAWSVVSYIVEDAKRKHEEIIESQYKAADAATANAERILALAVDMESAESGTDSLRKAQESLASAFETDLPDSIDVSIKKLRELTEEQIRAAAGAANTALITAGDEFTRASEGNGPTEYIAIMRERNANTGLEKNPYYDEDYLPGGLNEIVASRLSELNLRQKQEGDMYAIYDTRSLEGALKFHEAMELINSDIDEYVRLSGDRSVLDTEYYKTLQRYLSDTAGAFSIYEEKQKAAFDNEVMLEFLAAIQSTSVKSKEDVDALIESFRDTEKYTSDETAALIELTEKYFHFEDAVETSEAAVKKETDAIFANQKALEANATAADRAAAAKKDAEAAVSQFCDALFDETGELTAAGKAALAASQYLADLVQAELNARIETAKANYANLRAQLAAVATDALKAAYALIALEDAAAESGIVENDAARLRRMAGGADSLLRQLRELEGIINSTEVQATYVSPYTSSYSTSSSGHSGGGSSSSSSSTEDKKLTSLRDRVTLLKSELSLMQARGDSEEDQIAKMREIQAALEAERAYLASIKGDQATINGLAEEWWNYQNKITDLQEQAADAAQKQADAVQAALEATIALANAEKQRSVRVYNAATGQWEWQADPSKVASARESYNSAVGSLTDEERAVYESALAAWERSMLKQTIASYGLGGAFPDYIQRGAITSNLSNLFSSIKNGATYNMGGVTISEAQAKSMSVYDFAQLSGSLAAYNHSV